MLTINKKMLNASLAIILALGLGGCGISQATTTNHNSKPTSAKVVKHNNNHKVTTVDQHESSPATSGSNSYQQPTTSTSHAAASQVNSQPQKQQNTTKLDSGDVAVWTDAYGNVQHVNSAGMDRMTIPGSDEVKYQDWSWTIPVSAHINSSTHSNVQLGLADTAVWTDEYGTVHHVDSDGMDRMTIPGSDEVQYQDWSGYLPSNVTVVHGN